MTQSPLFSLSIEPVDGELIRYPLIGTTSMDEAISRELAVDEFHGRNHAAQFNPAKAVRTVALFRGNEMLDVYDGEWSSERAL